MSLPFCFVLMPFGIKESDGKAIDFDFIYDKVIKPSITDSGLEPIRADEEIAGGIIHKPMFERLILCDFAIADITTANANVFYELGIRHAIRPFSTVLICSKSKNQLPFDVRMSRVLYYSIRNDGTSDDTEHIKKDLTKSILEIKDSNHRFTDSPLFQLVQDFKPPEIKHLKTDLFLERVQFSNKLKEKVEKAKNEGPSSLKSLEESVDVKNLEYDVVISLFLAYRSIKAWPEMISLVEKMSQPLAETIIVQEQLALALNRNAKSEKAEKVLLELIEKKGGSSETYGILGRVYKDRWDEALKNNNRLMAAGYLNRAIDAYLKGFETDWRDAYPGINALTLMEIKNPPDDRRKQILPVVRYSSERRISTKKPDYWDYATLLELAVLDKDESKVIEAIANAFSTSPDKWQVESTLKNINFIRETRAGRKESTDMEKGVEEELKNYSK